LVNIGDAAGNYGVLYSKPIVDVIPNQPINVEVYLANLLEQVLMDQSRFYNRTRDASNNVVASQFYSIAGATARSK
jgi:hypothetical protein